MVLSTLLACTVSQRYPLDGTALGLILRTYLAFTHPAFQMLSVVVNIRHHIQRIPRIYGVLTNSQYLSTCFPFRVGATNVPYLEYIGGDIPSLHSQLFHSRCSRERSCFHGVQKVFSKRPGLQRVAASESSDVMTMRRPMDI